MTSDSVNPQSISIAGTARYRFWECALLNYVSHLIADNPIVNNRANLSVSSLSSTNDVSETWLSKLRSTLIEKQASTATMHKFSTAGGGRPAP